ncbi:molybdate transport system substrate-binding protein [Desulfomicrobium apsheronum]|uniref:Molybdate transport system substrate-binding protein n=1 Tax=Desulfomicrobium apsheronum TaxID=52560 RepID=A0A1I3S6N7_9BACT|nr:molybdate ABC transporter substrate-binding protein [Desulfomicrobium apsheronum]SFJ53722.1 molybdate transport system substrate-binding protein [Desulfomicrobium apsheronum]
MNFKSLHTILSLCIVLMSTPAMAGDLLVSAAASLTNAFTEMKEPFEKAHPETTLVLNFASSGALLKQMEQGAPVDVFASADQATMDRAEKLIDPATRVNFAGNALVLIVPIEGGLPLNDPAALKGKEVKLVAIGNPDSVPAGRYAKVALEHAGLYEALTPKFVLAESVRQALDYVARGEVQAGFVFATDAALRADKVKVTAEIAGHKPITYPVALLGASREKEMGQAFIDFVKSEEGQGILGRFGFKRP